MGTEKDIKFAISGSALSFLYYECDKSRTDQIGFLIGERNSYVTKAISDAEINGEKSETVINIVASLTVGLPSQFCNNVGRVDRVKLKEILGSLEKDIYGWYIFRRNAGLSPLLRGTIIHRELLAALPHVTPRTFVLGCFGSDATNTRSTHRLRHIFLRHEDRVFRPTAVHIINFGQEYNLNYRNLPLTSSLNTSVNDVLATVKVSKNGEALTILKALQKPLLGKVLEIADQVQQYEKKARDLANEVQELKYNLTNPIAEQTKNGNKSSDRNIEMEDEDEDEGDIDDDKNEQKDQVQEKVIAKEEEKDNKVKGNEDSEDVVYSSQKQQPLLLSQIVGRSSSQQIKILNEGSDNSESPSILDNFQPSEEY